MCANTTCHICASVSAEPLLSGRVQHDDCAKNHHMAPNNKSVGLQWVTRLRRPSTANCRMERKLRTKLKYANTVLSNLKQVAAVHVPSFTGSRHMVSDTTLRGPQTASKLRQYELQTKVQEAGVHGSPSQSIHKGSHPREFKMGPNHKGS